MLMLPFVNVNSAYLSVLILPFVTLNTEIFKYINDVLRVLLAKKKQINSLD